VTYTTKLSPLIGFKHFITHQISNISTTEPQTHTDQETIRINIHNTTQFVKMKTQQYGRNILTNIPNSKAN